MPDIFGRHEGQYTLRRDLREAGQLEAYEASRAEMMPFAVPRHDFESFGAGAPSSIVHRAMPQRRSAT